jgi:hypothetical protein
MKIGTFMLALLIPVAADRGVSSDEIRILNWRQSGLGSGLELVFMSKSASYYEVRTTRDINGAWHNAAMILGLDGEQTWSDTEAAGDGARYYRLVARLRSEAADADNDGLDDVFELTHSGMNPLVRDASVAVSIRAANESIAAGAMPTAVHQTEVVLQVIPPGPYRVSVWLEGGDGYAGGGPATEGPAKLEGGGAVFLAGGVNASRQPIVITTDTNGRATFRLTSSNEVNEQATVHARLGTHTDFGGSHALSAPITFELGTVEVEFPRFLARDAYASAVVHRKLNGAPIPGHETEIYVRRVRVNSEEFVVDANQADDLAAYALIDPDKRRQRTDQNGQARAAVFIRDVEGLGYVEIKAVDLQVFGK